MEQEIILKEKKDIRLLVDAHVFDGIFQGTRTFLKGIYNHLNTDHYSIKIFLAACNIENLKKEFSGKNNVEFIQLKSQNKFIRLGYEIPKIISHYKIDYAHFNYYLPLFRNKKCKYIVTIHDVLFLDYPQYFPKSYYYKNKFLFKLAAKKSDLLNTVSLYSAERIKEHFKLKNKEITILPNAIDESFKTFSKKEKDRLYIKQKFGISNFLIYVSRIEPRKNHISILKAYEDLELWKQNIELVFIGKKAINNLELESYFSELKKKSYNKIHHLENVNFQDLKPFYNAALISLFPSFCEGFGIPPLESAALKTPTICSNLTAMREFHFFDKYHINPVEPNSINHAISNLLLEIKTSTNESRLDRVSQKVINQYQWSKTAKILADSIMFKNETN